MPRPPNTGTRSVEVARSAAGVRHAAGKPEGPFTSGAKNSADSRVRRTKSATGPFPAEQQQKSVRPSASAAGRRTGASWYAARRPAAARRRMPRSKQNVRLQHAVTRCDRPSPSLVRRRGQIRATPPARLKTAVNRNGRGSPHPKCGVLPPCGKRLPFSTAVSSLFFCRKRCLPYFTCHENIEDMSAATPRQTGMRW